MSIIITDHAMSLPSLSTNSLEFIITASLSTNSLEFIITVTTTSKCCLYTNVLMGNKF